MYNELVRKLRSHNGWALNETLDQAADAIEELQQRAESLMADAILWEDMSRDCKARYKELLHAAKKMHTWIFLNTGDEQKAYDECGLSDEMNDALGYGGRFEIVVPKEDEA